MVFRRNETTNECIDYVQFRLSNGQITQKYCGIITTGFSLDRRFQDSYRDNMWGMGLGAVKSEKGVEVVIFIDKEPLQEDESMELVMVFTFYTGEIGSERYFKVADTMVLVFFVRLGDSFRCCCC